MEKNKVKVLINGAEYTLVSAEPAEYVQRVAIRVDRKLSEIKSENPQLTNVMAAMLTAINFSDEYIKLEDSSNNLRKQVAAYAKNESKLSAALDERTLRVKELESQVQELKIELARISGKNTGTGYRK
ncbi:MAG: cell division protein ZapA [Ruminococcaceae bacterium]|nr:cell division protein ZapA [Oscillospiraceae bacterium]